MTTGKLAPVLAAANQMAAALGAVRVEDGEMYPFLQEMQVALPAIGEVLAQGIRNLETSMQTTMPLHPSVSAVVGQAANTQAHVGQTLGAVAPAIRSIHHELVAHNENPMTNQRAWNVK